VKIQASNLSTPYTVVRQKEFGKLSSEIFYTTCIHQTYPNTMHTTKRHIPHVLKDRTRKETEYIDHLQYTATFNYNILQGCYILAPVSLRQENDAHFVTDTTLLHQEIYCGYSTLIS
jgi:hypothetical protein